MKLMKDPLGVSPSKGNQGTRRGKEKLQFKIALANSSAILWNSLPSAAWQATSLTNFQWLLQHSCKTGFNLVYFSFIVSDILNYRRLICIHSLKY